MNQIVALLLLGERGHSWPRRKTYCQVELSERLDEMYYICLLYTSDAADEMD